MSLPYRQALTSGWARLTTRMLLDRNYAMQLFQRATVSLLVVGLLALSAGNSSAQNTHERVISEHIRVRVPPERESVGRDVILDLEHCWRFMNGITSLPRRILLIVDWDRNTSFADVADSRVMIGMNSLGAVTNERAFLLHSAAREMARLGLLGLTRGNTPGKETEFLYEGMAETLAREYEHSSRSLAGAWVVARFLDKTRRLGFKAQSSFTDFSGGRHDLRAAAPGITLLAVCRELYGREKLIKLFEAFRKGGLEESLSEAFKTTPDSLEAAWLKQVRDYALPESITSTSEEDAPVLERALLAVPASKPEGKAQLQLFVADRGGNLSPGSVFVTEASNGVVLQTHVKSSGRDAYFWAELPPPGDTGKYTLQITAVDDAGNVRNWKRVCGSQPGTCPGP